MANRQIKLGFILQGPGITWADWRHPDAEPGAMYDFDYFRRTVQALEHGKFDFAFLADQVYITAATTPYSLSKLEPLTLMSALAIVTSRIGLVATASSTYTEPFTIARQFGSLDHLSKGRAGWNLVTSYTRDSALNYSLPALPEHDLRYRRAGEHLDVVQSLWDSWEDDAMIHDKASGVFFDKSKLHTLNHKGEFFQVKGPLNLSRSPQGQPVIFQAGASDTGRDFAAKRADGIFLNPFSMREAVAFTRDVKSRAAAFGRDPGKLFVFSSMRPFLGATTAEAEARYAERANLIETKDALAGLAKFFDQYDFSQHDVEGPFPAGLTEKYRNGLQDLMRNVTEMARDGMTLGQVARRVSLPRGDFVGTPVMIADAMQRWVEAGAADGFMVGDGLPGDHVRFIAEVIPILQERGLFRREYEGTTLRESLGLDRVPSRFAEKRLNN